MNENRTRCGDVGAVDRRASRRGMGAASSVAIFELCEDQEFIATSNSDYVRYVLSGPEMLHIGPAIEDIVIHAEGSNFSSFSYKVALEYKGLKGSWNQVTLLEGGGAAYITSETYTISSAYSTRTSFGIQIRIVLLVQANGAGVTAGRGNMNVWAAVRFFN